MVPGAKMGDSTAQRQGGDYNRKCHLVLLPESTLLPCTCVAASNPILRSLREWQECQGDVNGDIRSYNHQHRARGTVSYWSWGAAFLLGLTDMYTQVYT